MKPVREQADDFQAFMHAIYSARKRAKLKERDSDLTEDVARSIWRRCKGRCELTGIPFDFAKLDGCRRRPFMPSIDRIDCAKGYTVENIRVVCTAANLAMNQWGEDVLFRMARGLAMNR